MTIAIPNGVAYVHYFKAYLASDHLTAATGKTIPIKIMKSGGAFGDPAAGATNATEDSLGWYHVSLGTSDISANGWLAINGTLAAIDTVDDRVFVVNANTGGLAALPNTACTTNASLITSGTGTSQLSVASGGVDLQTIKTNPVVNAGTVTFPTTATLASTTNITAGTMTTTTNLTTNNDKTGYALTSGEHTALAGDILDSAAGIETGKTVRQGLRIFLAALGGKASGLDLGTPVFRDSNDTKNRISATTDTYGNRSSVTFDVT